MACSTLTSGWSVSGCWFGTDCSTVTGSWTVVGCWTVIIGLLTFDCTIELVGFVSTIGCVQDAFPLFVSIFTQALRCSSIAFAKRVSKMPHRGQTALGPVQNSTC